MLRETTTTKAETIATKHQAKMDDLVKGLWGFSTRTRAHHQNRVSQPVIREFWMPSATKKGGAGGCFVKKKLLFDGKEIHLRPLAYRSPPPTKKDLEHYEPLERNH